MIVTNVIGSLALIVLSLVIYAAFGFLVLHLLRKTGLFNQDARISYPSYPFILMAVGAPIFTLLQVYLSWLGLPIKISLMIFGVLATSLIAFHVKKVGFQQYWPEFKRPLWVWIFGVAILVSILFSFLQGYARTAYTWDAIAFWTPKSIAIWIDQTVNVGALTNANHPEYPLFVPMIGANTFSLAGVPDEFTSKAILMFIAYSLIAAWLFDLLATIRTPRSIASVGFFLLLFHSSFVIRDHLGGEYLGTADLFVGLYFFLGSAMLLKKRPALALLLWSILPWIKSEGQSLSLILYILMFLKYSHLRKWSVLAGSVLILPWLVWNRVVGNNSSQYFQFDQIYARPWLEYVIYSLHSFREEFRYLDRWGLIFLVSAFVILRNIKQILLSSRHLIILTAILLQLVIYVIIFTITPEEQASFITSAIARLTLHFAPVVIALSANLVLEEDE